MTSQKTIERNPSDGKKVFRQKGTCSQTFAFLLNREFGNNDIDTERAADPLAGGILKEGHQCGMLWGASLAIGTEAYKKSENLDQAMQVAVKATQLVMESFEKRESTTSCREVTHCNFNNKLSFAKYMLSGRFLHCFNLAQEWAPDAVDSALKGLNSQTEKGHIAHTSCASEVVKKMGGTEEDMVKVAGFAGGLGLSGSACGALAAAIWYRSLLWCRENPEKSPYKIPEAYESMEIFKEMSNSKVLCSEITEQKFDTLKDHSKYLSGGGCEEIMSALVNLKNPLDEVIE